MSPLGSRLPGTLDRFSLTVPAPLDATDKD